MLLGCSGGAEVAPPVVDAAPDDTAVVDTGPASGIPRCGPGPWVIHSETFSEGWGKNLPVVDMPARVDACPEIEYRTDAQGTFTMTERLLRAHAR